MLRCCGEVPSTTIFLVLLIIYKTTKGSNGCITVHSDPTTTPILGQVQIELALKFELDQLNELISSSPLVKREFNQVGLEQMVSLNLFELINTIIKKVLKRLLMLSKS